MVSNTANTHGEKTIPLVGRFLRLMVQGYKEITATTTKLEKMKTVGLSIDDRRWQAKKSDLLFVYKISDKEKDKMLHKHEILCIIHLLGKTFGMENGYETGKPGRHRL